jgi:hypothetical protein
MDRPLLLHHSIRLVTLNAFFFVLWTISQQINFHLKLDAYHLISISIYLSLVWSISEGHRQGLFKTLKRLGWRPQRGVLFPYLLNMTILIITSLNLGRQSATLQNTIYLECDSKQAKIRLCSNTLKSIAEQPLCERIHTSSDLPLCVQNRSTHHALYPQHLAFTQSKRGQWVIELITDHQWVSIMNGIIRVSILSFILICGLYLPWPQVMNIFSGILAIIFEIFLNIFGFH